MDAGRDFAFCNALSVEECEIAGCRRITGQLEDDYCGERTTERVPLACHATDDGCGESVECAVRPDDGARFTFFSSCTPQGWAACELCSEFEECNTVASEPKFCIDEAADENACDDFGATYGARFVDIRDASNACVADFDCTTETTRFECGTANEVLFQGCPQPIARDAVCAYRQAQQDLETELCEVDTCIPSCVSLASCPPQMPVVCVDGRCAFAPL